MANVLIEGWVFDEILEKYERIPEKDLTKTDLKVISYLEDKWKDKLLREGWQLISVYPKHQQ